MGIVLVAYHRGSRRGHGDPPGQEINLETLQLGRKLRGPIDLPLHIPVLEGDVLSFYIADLAKCQADSLGTGGLTSCVEGR
jgi:hypothetical protein